MKQSKKPRPQKAEHQAVAPERKVGRPRAKRSNPEFQQVTAYIRRESYISARHKLLDEGRDFSELIEELVSAWIGRKA